MANGNNVGSTTAPLAWTPEDDKALQEATRHLSTAHLSFIAVSIYLTLAIWQTTHQQLLLGASFTLPVLNVAIDLVTFYTLGPWLYVLMHATLLTQLRLFARRAFRWSDAHGQNRDSELPLGLSPLLYYLLLQRMALSRLMLATAVGTTLLIGPLLLVWLFQVRFLAYHDGTVTMWQRIAVFADAAVLLLLWPQIVSRRVAQAKSNGSRRGRLRRFVRQWLCGFHDERLGCSTETRALVRARRRTLRAIALSVLVPLPLLLGLSWGFRDTGDADGLLLTYAACGLAGLVLAYWQVRRPANGKTGAGDDLQARSPFVLSYATIIATASICSLSLFTLVPSVEPDACLPQPENQPCAPLAVASGRSWLEPLILRTLATVSGRRLLMPGQIEALNYQLLGPSSDTGEEAERWQPGWCARLDQRGKPKEAPQHSEAPSSPPRRCGRLGPVAMPTALLFEPDLQRGDAGDARRRLLPSRYLHLRGVALDMDIKPEDVALGGRDKAQGDRPVCARTLRKDNQPFDPGEKRIWQYARALRVQYRNLAGADLRDTSLPLGQFQTVSLFGAMLDGSYLNGARLYRVDLRHASLTWSHLDNSDWDGVQADFGALDHADLRCARLGHTDLVGARLIGIEIAALELDDADLRGAVLVDAVDPGNVQRPSPPAVAAATARRDTAPPDGCPDAAGNSRIAGLAIVGEASACALLKQALPPPCTDTAPPPAPARTPQLYGTSGDALATVRTAAADACRDHRRLPDESVYDADARRPYLARHANALVLMAPPFAIENLGQSKAWVEALSAGLRAPCPALEDPLLHARLQMARQYPEIAATPAAARACAAPADP